MSVPLTLLGLLETGPSHGYELKRAHDALFPSQRPLAYGQVYATLSRLLRGGMVSEAGAEPGEGPERRRYAITSAGVTDVDRWLATPEEPAEYLRSALYTKIVIALLAEKPASEVLDAQRSAHLTAMRQLTERKRSGDLADQLICDHALLHLQADINWLELAAARLDELAANARSRRA